MAAVAYARIHFNRFKDTQMPGIQRLMGCLCYTKRPLPPTYLQLMAPDQWDCAAREFARQCCSLLGQVCALALSKAGCLDYMRLSRERKAH